MEDIGHSRLLKFLVNGKEKNKMEAPVFKIQFEYITPTNIESEVPGKQDIREASEEIATENALDNKVENPEDYVLSPVITVTKQESEFTKGDLKLQKVSVTENISEGMSADYTINYIINSNPNIQSEVIRTQPVRVMEDERKTRIPTLKTKQQIERRRSVDKKDEVLPSRLLQKQSSIPRLKDSRIPPPLDRRASKPDVKMETPQPDEEFEKIYGEIISEPKEIVTDIIESIKVDDPEKLDNKFEEIIHDYEENKLQPITVDVSVKINKPRSKIPLSKRKSEQDIKIPTPAEKISVNDEPKLEKIETRLPVHKDLSHKTGKSKYNIRCDDKPNTVNIIDINKPKIIQKSNIDDSIEPVKVAIKEITETKMKESIVKYDNKPISNDVKVISENTSDVALSNVINTEPEIIPELIQQKNIVIIDPIITNSNDIKNKIKINENRENQINEIVPILDNNKHYSKNDEKQNMDTEYKPGKVSRLLQRIQSQEFGTDNINPKKGILIDVPKKKTVLSKIAMFERQDSDEEKLRIKPPLIKSKEIKSEILSEKIVDRKPVIVDELLKESNLDSIESFNTIECPSIESFDNLKKDYTVEIQNDKVKYLEIQDDNPDANDKYGTSTQFVTNRIYLDKTVDLSPNDEGNEPHSLKNKLVDIKNKIRIMKQNSRELLEPTPQNFDENVSRDTVIETTEHISTNYTTNAPIQKEKSDDLNLNDSETIEYDPYNCENKQNIPNDNTIQDYPNIKDEKSNNICDDKIDIPFVNIAVKEIKIETLDIGPMSFDDKVENDVFSKSSNLEMREVLNKNREITNERPKSDAQLDLGDAIKGKVHQMVVRMNSVEKIENNRKEINPRERPRKKSVSKIIALFEVNPYLTDPSDLVS